VGPRHRLVETDNEITLAAELPGLNQTEIEISVDDGVLSSRGDKTEERKDDGEKKFYLFERSYGVFRRSFTLPSAGDPTIVTAEFDNGVLTVHPVKSVVAKPKGRKIEVKSVPATDTDELGTTRCDQVTVTASAVPDDTHVRRGSAAGIDRTRRAVDWSVADRRCSACVRRRVACVARTPN
jgi:HSP20 family molecular chaperone IbpA